jgi:hypothetical protein
VPPVKEEDPRILVEFGRAREAQPEVAVFVGTERLVEAARGEEEVAPHERPDDPSNVPLEQAHGGEGEPWRLLVDDVRRVGRPSSTTTISSGRRFWASTLEIASAR